MERPAKRMRLSDQDNDNNSGHGQRQPPTSTSAAPQHNGFAAIAPTRTINLSELQRPTNYLHSQPRLRGRNAGMVLLPRVPDATVTADAVVVAVNDGSITSEIPAPTADTAVMIGGLGTLTVPAVDDAISSISSGLSAAVSSATGLIGSLTNTTALSNPLTTTEHTVTVTSTSTYSVSYANGTFIIPATTHSSKSSASSSDSSDTTTSTDRQYTFGEGFTYTSSPTPTDAVYTTGGVAGAGATQTTSGATTTSTSGSGSGAGSSGPALTPKQAQTVGGVVGGVAGIAFVLVIVLYVLRWYRQHLKSQGRLPEQLVGEGHNEKHGALARSVASLAQSSRSSFFPGFAGHKLRPGSDVTELTETTSPAVRDSEKGFQRISGRKITPVLPNGGDPYGGNYGVFEQSHFQQPRHNLSEASFYRDSAGIYIGRHNNASSHSEPSSPTLTGLLDRQVGSVEKRPSLSSFPAPPSSIAASDIAAQLASPTRRDGFAMMRSSPARTPVSQSPATTSIKLPIQASVTMDEDIPEMPLSPHSFGGPGAQSLQAHQITPSRFSQRSGSTGRFREDL